MINKRCEGCIYCDDYDCDNCSFNLNTTKKSNCDIFAKILIIIILVLFILSGLLSLYVLLR